MPLSPDQLLVVSGATYAAGFGFAHLLLALRRRRRELAGELSPAELELEARTEELATLREAYAETREKVAEFGADLDALQEQHAAQLEECARLRSENERSETQLASSRAEGRELTMRLTELEHALATNTDRFAAIAAENAQKLRARDGEIAALRERLGEDAPAEDDAPERPAPGSKAPAKEPSGGEPSEPAVREDAEPLTLRNADPSSIDRRLRHLEGMVTWLLGQTKDTSSSRQRGEAAPSGETEPAAGEACESEEQGTVAEDAAAATAPVAEEPGEEPSTGAPEERREHVEPHDFTVVGLDESWTAALHAAGVRSFEALARKSEDEVLALADELELDAEGLALDRVLEKASVMADYGL